ncbi:MAG: sensor domain-containing protein [Actinomycetota bacterium]|jgi:hypothetical protein|nr:sensor domain-containing protein [Actinomycetota bacterium]
MIEQYLKDLKAQLAGQDPALAQDALYDAEEHLRAEMADVAPEEQAARFEEVVESYGSPEEVATAYRETEITVAKALKAPKTRSHETFIGKFFGVLVDPQAWGAVVYMLLSIITGTVYFTIVTTGVSLSLGLAILIIGIPIMLLFLGIVRAVSLLEGRIVEGLLGVRMPRRPRMAPSGGNLWERIKWWLSDYRTWTTMLYMGLQLPLGVFYFSVTVSLASFFAGTVAAPFVQVITGEPIAHFGDYGYMLYGWAMPLVVVGGLLGFVVLMHLVKLAGRLHGAYAKVMLVGNFSESAAS